MSEMERLIEENQSLRKQLAEAQSELSNKNLVVENLKAHVEKLISENIQTGAELAKNKAEYLDKIKSIHASVISKAERTHQLETRALALAVILELSELIALIQPKEKK